MCNWTRKRPSAPHLIHLTTRFISPMRTASPAARATHAAIHFGERLGDANTTCFGFFSGNHPTNPLAPRERRNV